MEISRKNLIMPAAVILATAIAAPVLAHSPYLAANATGIAVRDPEISKAYYGWLDGKPAVYSISSPKPFDLYLNLLSPRADSAKLDYSAKIFKDGKLVQDISGRDAVWLVEYEPFANDYYLKGPEYETPAPAGDYRIEVYDSGNSGNYVLAIGKRENITPAEFLRALAVLPRIKQEFWGKPLWQAYDNFMGLAAFIIIVVSGIAAYFAISFIKRRRQKLRLDKEYGKYKNNRIAWRADCRGPFGTPEL